MRTLSCLRVLSLCLESLRALIKSMASDALEGINYKMLSYSKGVIFHLNARKNYVSL